MMTAKSYCRLAALIFAVVAVLQLIRAVVVGRSLWVRQLQSRYGQVGSPALLLGCLPGLDLRHLGSKGYDLNVRFGSLAELLTSPRHVRFTPQLKLKRRRPAKIARSR